MIYVHYKDAPWDTKRWPNFTAKELACPSTGEFWYDPIAFDATQLLRNTLGNPVFVNSAHRSLVYNLSKKIGSTRRSEHLKFALDISLRGHTPFNLFKAATHAGFKSFGFYKTFLHMDFRTKPNRRWFTKEGRITWQGVS